MMGELVAMGGARHGVAVVVEPGTDRQPAARLVYEREDGLLLAGSPATGWDRADEEETALWRAAEPWNAG